MGQSDNNDVTPFRKFVRQMLSTIDTAGLYLLVNVYKIFFNVATAEILNGQYSRDIFVRVQMILGVFMLFKLSASILSGIVDPAKFTDQKQGFGNIIKRVITSLVLLTLVVPLNIPNLSAADNGTYNAELYNNGILFGTMYSLQKRILTGDVIGKLLIGGDNINYFSESADLSDNKDSDISKAANKFATSVLRAFIRINLVPDSQITAVATGRSYESEAKNIMCSTESGASYAWDDSANDQQTVTEAIHNFSSEDLTYTTLIYEATNATCNIQGNHTWATKGLDAANPFKGDGGERWVFNYIPILPFLATIILSVVLLASTIDVAVRAIKLAVLRIIAPIPIISYMDPKSSGDKGMFTLWTRSVISTYLDLFIRVGLIYGALYFINEFIVNGIVINQSTGVVGAISFIFIALGMIYFARTGPKFIKDTLGLQGISNIGMSGVMAGIGAVRAGGHFGDAFRAGQDAVESNIAAVNQGKQAAGIGDSYNFGADAAAKAISGDDKMTYRQMRRGRGIAAREGATPDRKEDLKAQMYAAQDEQQLAQTMMDNVSRNGWNSLSNNEQQKAEAAYRKRKKITVGPLSQAQVDDMHKYGATDYYNETRTAAGKAKSAYDKMDAELSRLGQNKSYGYDEDRTPHANSTFGDSMHHAGREAGYHATHVVDSVTYGAQQVSNAALDSINFHNSNSRVNEATAQRHNDVADRTAIENAQRVSERNWDEDKK